jgi:AcrR family transcriptional regulator
MVQKSERKPAEGPPRRRGRPRAFDPDAALTQAMDVFWKEGFAATSLDDLSLATGLNRPSLYGAFGDKRALYIQAYRRYREHVREAFAPLFAESAPLRAKLRRILLAALDLYLSGEDGPRGCFTVLTASSDAIADPEIRDIVAEAIETIDRSFGRLFAKAREAGALPADTDARRLARMAQATIHTLSVRARARYPRAELVLIVDDAVATICGPEASPADRRSGKP